ncbi:MAG: hypothetical protein H3C31_09385 [Brumimicrobium sp.]|nr:hypothetical protein [Brumimicrobium sp.]MCO5269219.1 hypothetical protein [Brumimicrobium sp.]
MKKFWAKFRYFSIGLVLGTIFVLVVFGDRACSWLPGHRIKEDILGKVIVFPEDQLDALNAMGISGENISDIITHGKILFSESVKKPTVYPKAYVLELTDGNTRKRVQFSLYEDSYISIVHPLKEGEKASAYKQLKGWGKMVHFPSDSSLVYIDNSEYTMCKASGLADTYPNHILNDLRKTGKVDFSHSNLMLTKASLRVSFTQNDTLHVDAETIIYKYRITFKDFYWDSKLPCEK